MKKLGILLRITTSGIALSIMACAAPSASSTGNAMMDNLTTAGCTVGEPDPRACDPSDTKKTTICHIPPGNPGNAHTICVGNSAVPAHLDHGDFIGTCSCTGGGGDAGGADANTCDANGGGVGSNYGGGSGSVDAAPGV